ncbi:SDR family oxidoreductase [Pseudomonadota bacterium]|nr:SDR family oxidoreductase [Pseudomonadota bacterium]
MKDKCFLVTGSSSGIGRAITIKLLDSGAKVIGIARNHSKPKLEHKNYLTYSIDLSKFNDLEKIIKKIIQDHPEINGLISNAGYGEFGPLENFSVNDISSFFSMNLTSHIIITKCLLPHLKKKEIGDIIFMGSEASLTGEKNGTLYCSAKFGLRGFSQALRKDVSNSNIRVCIINPGMVRTNFFNSLKFSPGEDINNAVSEEDISNAVLSILTLGRNTVVDEINLSPLKKVIKFK